MASSRSRAGAAGTLVLLGMIAGSFVAADASHPEPPSVDCDRLAWTRATVNEGGIVVARGDGSHAITATDDTWSGQAEWSNDGRYLAWVNDSRELMVLDTDGTDPVTISAAPDAVLDFNQGVAWSPAGSRIAWAANDGSDFHIFTADADGSNRRNVSASTSSATFNLGPSWSPDGSRIAWTGRDDGVSQAWIADADGTGTAVSVAGTVFAIHAVDWSPAGDRIVLWSAGLLVISDVDGSNAALIGTPFGAHDWAWSPDGARLAWTDAGELWTVVADGTDPLEVSTVEGSDPFRSASEPAWSPDGTQLAWRSSRFGSGIHVADADGADRRLVHEILVPEDPLEAHDPTWSPDGARLAWWGQDDGGDNQIWVADINRGGVAEISSPLPGPPHPSNRWPTWQPRRSPFSDVDPDSYARNDIACLYALDITTGTAPTTYSPHDPVTREQMAAFLARTLRTAGHTCPTDPDPFTDVEPDSYARNDIACLYALDITTGTAPTTYSPHDPVTREQMAAFLARTLRTAGHTCPTDPDPFTDVDPDSYAHNDIACLYALDITTGTAPTTYSPHDPVTREQMAAFLARTLRTGLTAPAPG